MEVRAAMATARTAALALLGCWGISQANAETGTSCTCEGLRRVLNAHVAALNRMRQLIYWRLRASASRSATSSSPVPFAKPAR